MYLHHCVLEMEKFAWEKIIWKSWKIEPFLLNLRSKTEILHADVLLAISLKK
jgi:hypothetical protein